MPLKNQQNEEGTYDILDKLDSLTIFKRN